MIIIRTSPRGHRPSLGFALVALLALTTLLATLCTGEPMLAPSSALAALFDGVHPLHVLITEVRLPRALLGLVAGAGLGVCGLMLQDGLRNPIAGPELLGVSAGAAVVVSAVVVFGIGVPLAAQPWLGLAGALVAGAIVLLAIGRTSSAGAVVLIGASVAAACGGLVVAIVGLGTQGDVVLLFRYLLGSLAARGWAHLEVVAPLVGVCIAGAWLLRRRVEALTLGDEVAVGLGVSVVSTRLLAVAIAALLAAAIASACGPVAFVALLAPHIARRLARSTSTARIFPLAAASGGLILLAADLAARTVIYPVELPVGVATTLVGVPALLVLRPTGTAS